MPNTASTQLLALQQALEPFKSKLSVSVDADIKQVLLTDISNNNCRSITLPIRMGAVIDLAKALIYEGKESLIYLLGDKKFLPDTQKLTDKKQEDVLTQKEVEILLCLIQGGERGQSKNYLMEHVWGQRADLDTHTIETHIYRLRQKIEKDPNEPTVLLTINNGYQLIFYKD
jgi:DNA-binding response OmpR family regulator